MAYAGRCNCGSVTAVITAEPVATRQCWCRQCQKAASGSPTNNAIFPTDAVTLSGTITSWEYEAASGNTLTQTFCSTCGSHIFAQSSARPHLQTFRLGFLHEPHGLSPQVAIWTEEAPAWALIDPALPSFLRQPPPPPEKA